MCADIYSHWLILSQIGVHHNVPSCQILQPFPEMTPGIISNIHRGIVSLYINSVSTPPGVSHYSRLNNVCALTHKIDNDNYPCLCLCFGFSQITLMLPFLLMILHFSQIGLTDDLTFTSNPPFIPCLVCIFPLCAEKVLRTVRIKLYHLNFGFVK